MEVSSIINGLGGNAFIEDHSLPVDRCERRLLPRREGGVGPILDLFETRGEEDYDVVSDDDLHRREGRKQPRYSEDFQAVRLGMGAEQGGPAGDRGGVDYDEGAWGEVYFTGGCRGRSPRAAHRGNGG
jgi:hypothetical protein